MKNSDKKNREKPIRKRKPSWLYNQACAVPYQVQNDAIFVVLITSRRKGEWIFPKGVVEGSHTAAYTAEKETYEEAGVKGRIESILTEITYEKWNDICKAKVFALYVEEFFDDWPEKNKRKRKVVTAEEALSVLTRCEMKDALKAFMEWLEP